MNKESNNKKLQKHKFNIFPEMQKEELALLMSDIETNGYDKSSPVVLFEGSIIDGWNRYSACLKLGVNPTTTTFTGTQVEAIDFIMRTNKRRNLSSSQWACIAVEADGLIAEIRAETEKERREKEAAKKRCSGFNGRFGC